MSVAIATCPLAAIGFPWAATTVSVRGRRVRLVRSTVLGPGSCQTSGCSRQSVRADPATAAASVTRPRTASVLRVSIEREQRVSSLEPVLRPGLRVRVTQLSHRLLEDLTGGRVRDGAPPRGVVCVGLHLVDHQLVRSRSDGGAAAAGRRGAGQPGHVRDAAWGIRRARLGLRLGLRHDPGRSHVVLLLLGRDHQLTPNFRRVLVWMVLTGVLWVAGGLAHDAARAGPVGGGCRWTTPHRCTACRCWGWGGPGPGSGRSRADASPSGASSS